MNALKLLVAAGLVFTMVGSLTAAELTADQKTKLEAKITAFKAWSTDAEFVKAVKDFNTNPPAEAAAMTNDQWKTLTVMSPEVKALTKNALAAYIKTKKDESVSEAFVNGANGAKVAFLSKTTSWTHKGKPKHDVPMTGKTWTGEIEVDESTGVQSVQFAIPVLEAGKAIGSIVIGVNVAKL